MAFQRMNSGVVNDLGLMVFGVAMTLISFFAILALVFGVYVAIAGTGDLPHPVSGIALTLMLVMGFWNLMVSIRLVNSPDNVSAMWIVVRSMVAFCPVLAAIIFLA